LGIGLDVAGTSDVEAAKRGKVDALVIKAPDLTSAPDDQLHQATSF
jgi:hypothetical protein